MKENAKKLRLTGKALAKKPNYSTKANRNTNV